MRKRVLVTGGTGRLGREVVHSLQARGVTVRIMSRRQAPENLQGLEWATADLATGTGLRTALEGADVVLHLASLPYRGRRTTAVDVEGTGRLVHAAARADVTHLIYVSIVGVDAIPWPYFRKKLAAEERVRTGPVGWSIVRATQFYPLLDIAMSAANRLPILLGPVDLPGKPVDPRDVSARLVRELDAGPSRAVADFAGPEVLSSSEVAAQWLEVRGMRQRRMLRTPIPGALGRAFLAGKAVPAGGETGPRTWRSWLQQRYE